MNTIGQAPEATDAIMDAADPKYVKLELDVAHYLQGGGDPAAAVRKYKRRLLFLHLKDTKPSQVHMAVTNLRSSGRGAWTSRRCWRRSRRRTSAAGELWSWMANGRGRHGRRRRARG